MWVLQFQRGRCHGIFFVVVDMLDLLHVSFLTIFMGKGKDGGVRAKWWGWAPVSYWITAGGGLVLGGGAHRGREDVCVYTITHKKITELIPKQFRFGNSSTQMTEHSSQNNSVRDSVILF